MHTGDIVGSVPDHYNKGNIEIKSNEILWYPSVIKILFNFTVVY